MANLFQKIFRPEYQWRLMDMVQEYDISESFRSYDTDHRIPCGRMVFGKGSTRQYSMHNNNTYVCATRAYDSTLKEPISVRLYVKRERTDGDKRTSEYREENTAFAHKIYAMMRDKYFAEREFGW